MAWQQAGGSQHVSQPAGTSQSTGASGRPGKAQRKEIISYESDRKTFLKFIILAVDFILIQILYQNSIAFNHWRILIRIYLLL